MRTTRTMASGLALLLALLAACIITTIAVSNGPNGPLTNSPIRSKRSAMVRTDVDWVDSTRKHIGLAYSIDGGLGPNAVKMLNDSINFWRRNTCIQLDERKQTDPVDVQFVPGESFQYQYEARFGRQTAEEVQLVHVPQYDLPQRYIRAIGHLLGLGLEHQRDDRDQHLIFHPDNLEVTNPPSIEYFGIANNTYSYVPFDYGSMTLMDPTQYGKRIFETRNPLYQETPNQLDASFLDLFAVNLQYGCIVPNQCANQGFKLVNSEQCICPSGYGGRLCDERPQDGGETLWATQDWEHHIGSVVGTGFYETAKKTTWIQASEPNTGIEIVLYQMTSTCAQGCPDGGLEIKFLSDQSLAGASFCCLYEEGIHIVSNESLVPLIASNRLGAGYEMPYAFKYRLAMKPTDKGPTEAAGYVEDMRQAMENLQVVEKNSSTPGVEQKTEKSEAMNKSDGKLASTSGSEDEALYRHLNENGSMPVEMPTESWQENVVRKIGYNGAFSPVQLSYPERLVFENCSEFNLSQPSQYPDVAKTAGNCLFESLSYLITGNCDAHPAIRKAAVEFVIKEKDQQWIGLDVLPNEDLAKYKDRMISPALSGDGNEKWGSIREMLAFARLTEANIALWHQADKYWIILTPDTITAEDVKDPLKIPRPTLAIWYGGLHYRPIVSFT